MATMNTPVPADDAKADIGSDEDVDTIFASLEEEDHSEFRAKRAQELMEDINPASRATASIDKSYVILRSDDEALRFTTEHERAVLHFYHPDFARCSIMDSHCQQIASKHVEHGEGDVSFAKVDVKDCPFVVEKLSVRVLPCVIGFVKGVVKGRIIGFEGICWDGKEDSFTVTRAVEQLLVDWTIVKKKLLFGHEQEDDSDDDEQTRRQQRNGRRGIQGRKQKVEDEDDYWD